MKSFGEKLPVTVLSGFLGAENYAIESYPQ